MKKLTTNDCIARGWQAGCCDKGVDGGFCKTGYIPANPKLWNTAFICSCASVSIWASIWPCLQNK